jgi:hypothetical protein
MSIWKKNNFESFQELLKIQANSHEGGTIFST